MEFLSEITLDFNANNPYVTVGAKQGDTGTRHIKAYLLKDGVPYTPPSEAIAQFRLRKPDGKAVINECIINDDGSVSIYLTAQALAVAGRAYADIVFSEGNGIMSTVSFIIVIMAAPQVVQEITSSNEFGYLTSIVNSASIVINDAEAWAVGTRGGKPIIDEDIFFATTSRDDFTVSNYEGFQEAFQMCVGRHPGQKRTYSFTYRGSNVWGVVLRTEDGISTYVDNLPLTSSADNSILAYAIDFIGDPNVDDQIIITLSEKDPIFQNNAKYWAEQAAEAQSSVDADMPIITEVHDNLETLQSIGSALPVLNNVETALPTITDIHGNLSIIQNVGSSLPAINNINEDLSVINSIESALPTINNLNDAIPSIEAWSSNAAISASSASSFAEYARQQALNIENMTASASDVEYGEPATVTKTTSPSGIVNLHFDIPSGAAGQISSVTVETLEPGMSATISNNGTLSNAELVFGIPKGDTGKGLLISGTVSDVASLPSNVEPGTIYNVGTVAPYHLYLYENHQTQWMDLGQIQGATGKSAYEIAVDGGYQGTEEQFSAEVASLPDTVLVQAAQPSSISNKLWVSPAGSSRIQIPTMEDIPAGISAYTSNPEMDGTASSGSSTEWARGDHVHPSDTSRQAKITASGILKGDGTGNVVAAVAETDYGTYSKPSGGIPAMDLADGVIPTVPSAYTSDPVMDGTASPGSSTAWARGDHVHPHDSLIVRENLLDNWYFVGGNTNNTYGKFPVNQRGSGSYFASGYVGMDRWYWRGNETSSYTITEDGISIPAASDYRILSQPIKNGAERLAGKTVTISVLVSDYSATSGNASVGLVGAAGPIYLSDTYANQSITGDGLFYRTFTLPASISRPYVNFFVGVLSDDIHASVSMKVKAVKLELGNTQTLAHQEGTEWVLNEIPDYGEQLQKCQAYFVRTGGTMTYTGYIDSDGKTCRVFVPVPVTVATNAPTISFTSATGMMVNVNGTNVTVGTTSNPIDGSVTGARFPAAVRMMFKSTDALSSGVAYCIFSIPSIDISAEA